MCLKRSTLILISLFTLFPVAFHAQETPQLSAEEINDYTEQTKQLVKYLEGTLNFLGDPTQVPSEKDIIINDSYLKIFQSDETQIEDDLDPNRIMALNKDVQAYMKDVVFFFKRVSFSFEINSVDQLVNDAGQIYFKVTMNRNLEGITITGDSLNNNQIRYMEVNLDQIQKELKIASLYTTKPDRKIELKYWWGNMAESWRKFFGDSIFIYNPIYPEMTDAPTEFDTIAFWEILSFEDSTFIMANWREDIRLDTLIAYGNDTLDIHRVADSLLYLGDTLVDTTVHYRKVFDTIPIDVKFIYTHLEEFVSVRNLDISGNPDISKLNPVTELTNLVSVNFSNTSINDLTPLRNLNKLEIIICEKSKINTLEPLRFASKLREINCAYTPLSDITVLGNLKNLNKLNIGYTNIKDISALADLPNLSQLDLSGMDINDLTALESLSNLSDLNLSESSVTNLTSIGKIENLQSLNIDNTYVTRLDALEELKLLTVLQANSSRISMLDPLAGNSSLKFIYCDNTGIDGSKARSFMSENTHCLVIYNTKELEKWWHELPAIYKTIAREKMTVSDPITTEQLHLIINQTSIDFSDRQEIESIEPLKMLHRLESVILKNTRVSDLEPLGGHNNLRVLNISGTNVSDLEPLRNLNNLTEVSCEETEISNLWPLVSNSNLQLVYCDNSGVSQQNVLMLRDSLPECLVIFQTAQLKSWWDGLSSDWQDVFLTQMKFDGKYDGINLQKLVNLTKIVIGDNNAITELNPLSWFLNLETLTVSNTRVDDITPITNLAYLRELNLPNNPIMQVNGITNISSLKTLNLENTPMEDLSVVGQLNWLTTLNIAGTKVKKLKGIEGMASLENLFINNTAIKSLKGVEKLSNLKELKCYRTGINSKNIDKFKEEKPGVSVDYY